MKKYCLAVDLVNDAAMIAQYEEYHKAVNAWPEITESIYASGITSMEIYRTGNRLCMVIETKDDFDFANKAQLEAMNPKVQQWEELMLQFQQPLAWATKGNKWTLMEKIYSLPESEGVNSER